MKELKFRRWEVWAAFTFNVVAAVLMGFFLKDAINGNRNAVRQIQASRIESCQRTYAIIWEILDSSYKEREKSGRPLSLGERRLRARFFLLTRPEKCVNLVTPPPAKKEKK